MEQIKRVVEQKPKPLRYNILLRLQAYNPDTRAKIRAGMQKACGDVSKSTIHRWLNCRHGDSIDIPTTAIAKIAEILNCKIEDLFNHETEPQP